VKAKDALRLGEAFAQGIRDGITGVDLAVGKDRTAIMCLSCYREDCEHVAGVLADVLADVKKRQPVDLDPPSYLPMREPLPPRMPDLDPDEHGPQCPCDDCETERNR